MRLDVVARSSPLVVASASDLEVAFLGDEEEAADLGDEDSVFPSPSSSSSLSRQHAVDSHMRRRIQSTDSADTAPAESLTRRRIQSSDSTGFSSPPSSPPPSSHRRHRVRLYESQTSQTSM